MKGTVIKYNGSRGFGFIRCEKLEADIFVHIKSVTNAKHLTIGQEVSFEVDETPKGLAAVSVKVGGAAKTPFVKFAIPAVILIAVIIAAVLFIQNG